MSQLNDAAIIKRLRDLDVPLRDVAEVVKARDPEITRKVISEHEVVMRERLHRVTEIVEQLHQSLEITSLQTPVHIRHEPASNALRVVGEVSYAAYAPFLDDDYARLFAAVTATGATLCGPSAARYPAAVDTDSEEVEAHLPIAAPVTVDEAVTATGVSLGTIPAATCAVMTHMGGYDSIGQTYRQLGAWVAAHHVTAELPVREHYVVSVDPMTGELVPDDQLRTEISWPIKTGS